jgi:hypothetical protein
MKNFSYFKHFFKDYMQAAASLGIGMAFNHSSSFGSSDVWIWHRLE